MKLCGTDGALYLLYLKYASQYCIIVSFFNVAILIPIFMTGDSFAGTDSGQIAVSELDRLTINNIRGDRNKLVSVLIMTLFYSFIAYF